MKVFRNFLFFLLSKCIQASPRGLYSPLTKDWAQTTPHSETSISKNDGRGLSRLNAKRIMEEEKKEKRRAFTKQVRIKEKSLSWLRKNKGSYTMAGKLDQIINIYKKTYANEAVREMSREQVEI